MLKLAEMLCLDGEMKVTFVNTDHIQHRLFDCTDTQSYFTSTYPNSFQFRTIPDGLPQHHPRTVFHFSDLMASMEAAAAPILQEMLTMSSVTCVVADALLGFAADVASRIRLPLFFFETISPSALWTYMCLPQLIQAGEIPFKDDKLDEIIINTPGMEGILRRRDLPSFCRAIDFNDVQVKLVLREVDNIPLLARGLILNTFHQLDAPILSHMLTVAPNIYAIGPIHSHLQTRLTLDHPINSSSFWKEDTTCISWLDKQPSKSVIYVSIGSLSTMTKDQFLEIMHGLLNSGSRFLWVRRPGSVVGLDLDPMSDDADGNITIPKERGYIVSWAPQQEVLAHPAIGGFFTHSGWNSTLESIVSGKPMICWPHYVDQQVNSRYVGEVWKMGLDMKDSCDRVVVEKMVRELMELRKDEFLQRAEEMSKIAKSSVSKGGTSSADLDRLIHDIKMLTLPMKQS
ncbi:hypothetical protein C2S52_020163 [Perilla frutescens var. hirtella]|nr:hypothetical protein C2S52_020163 [Perilla frutescens var. hirtella]